MNTEPEKKEKVLTEVWGDTVNIKELAISIILGVIFTMCFYLIGRKIFMSMGTIEENLAKGYALFVGIAGCFIAAVISAKSFRPKRLVAELDSTTDIAEVLEYAHMTPEEEGEALTKVGPDVIKELEDLELYGPLALIPEGANNYKPEYRELAGGQSKKDA